MPSPLTSFMLVQNIRHMMRSISSAAAYCAKSSGGKHHFQGYPKEKARCKRCGEPRTREV